MKAFNKIRGCLRKNDRGVTIVLVTVFAVALFAFAALSIDVGNVFVQRARLQEAGDSAALAAVRDWAGGASASVVNQIGQNFSVANGVQTNEVLSVRVGRWIHASRTFEQLDPITATDVPAVEVILRRNVAMAFARVVGMDAMAPRTVSVAIAGRASAAARVLPWAVCDSFVPTRCATITVQFKGGEETNACSDSGPLQGNFGQLTLPGGSGASWYRSNIENGYNGILRVDQCFDTDPGVSWGPTRGGIDDRLDGLPPYNCTPTSDPPTNKRLGIIPKVDQLDVSGKKQVCITGFYVVSLDGYNNSQKTVTVTFLETYNGTEVDPNAPPVEGELNAVALVK